MTTLSNALSNIVDCELRNKNECIISPASKNVEMVLKVMQKSGYIGKIEFIDDGRGGKIEVQLLGRINKCNAIRPIYSVKLDEIEFWEKKYLPSKDIGILILSTNKGAVTHKEAKENSIGGKLLAYVY